MANPATSSKSKARPSARPYREGKGFAMRRRYKGHDIYVSGGETGAAAEKAITRKVSAIDNHVKPSGLGADKTTLAQALQDYALRRLPFLKGAVQEARRINHYLRYAGLELLVVIPRKPPKEAPTAQGQVEEKAEKKKKTGAGAYFEVKLEPHTTDRKIAKGLVAHRKAQLTQNARTEKHRAVLATTKMSEVTRDKVQALVDAMRHENNAPATIALERSMLRVLFFYAFTVWKWTELQDNPATKLTMPMVDNERERVMTLQEQELLDVALTECRNGLVAPVIVLLRETAMRSSEPLEKAQWRDVDWESKILYLGDSKSGKRKVPLSPVAINTLRELGPGEADERIVKISYESLKASWQRACLRAGIKDLNLHDLRRTAATRMALKTGNAFLVQSLTGHKTLAMVARYVKVSASDVVNVMHAPEPAAAAPVKPQQAQPLQAPVQDQGPLPAASATNDAPVTFTYEQVQAMVQMGVDVAIGRLNPATVPGRQSAAQTVAPEERVTDGNVVPLRKAA